MTPFDQLQISQLLSPYTPDQAPTLPMDFGDYLSILWRMDQAADQNGLLLYYKKCESVLATAFGFANAELGRLVRATQPGHYYEALPQLPYRGGRLVDAADRRASIQQLLRIRNDILVLGTYDQDWHTQWPGSGIIDTELRERMFAILFTALPSQYPPFSRLLLVTDIVLQELLTGSRQSKSILPHILITDYGFPDPNAAEVQQMLQRD